MPAREGHLSPLVGGEVIARAPVFDPGERVGQGAVLLRIDPADYHNAVQERHSALQQALAALALEEGRQEVARQDYRLLGEELPDDKRSLVLRTPQLDSARAAVEAARAALEQAKLELARTSIRAPFAAQVLSREVDVGSQVAPGDRLGRLVGTDTYWVVATVPLPKLRWIRVPTVAGETGAAVRIANRAAWPAGRYRQGHIRSLIGSLEEQTRLARLLVTVPDPLALDAAAGQPPLMLGAYVAVQITGEPIAEVVRLDRDYLRSDDTVWVMAEDRLQIRKVDVLFQDADYAYLAAGLQAEELVVTSNLSTVTEGVRLRRAGDENSATEAAASGGGS